MNTLSQVFTQPSTFGQTTSGAPLYSVQAGLPLSEVLEQVAINLDNAAVLCAETVDADLQTGRSMNQIIAQLVEASRGLIDAALDGCNHPGHLLDEVL
ncbi:hypothetical protein PMM47T1_05766 [Pseudomonas sp. M47T1]|uniref:hypothetical protein n=1 Tax=Pseudomonas sp. M47T1 TaxID=1179778 RepID=UPI0002607219|nr:hypothetical protein [Pseudomonas sp. M47T1]EIK97266.1 hypothetical protein PMM47T1_05766 [Pseudomonas sp. M47T1]